MPDEKRENRDQNPPSYGKYTIFHALFEALKEKDEKKAKKE